MSKLALGDEIYTNGCSMITYPNYKFIFPIKVLGMFAKRFGDFEIM